MLHGETGVPVHTAWSGEGGGESCRWEKPRVDEGGGLTLAAREDPSQAGKLGDHGRRAGRRGAHWGQVCEAASRSQAGCEDGGTCTRSCPAGDWKREAGAAVQSGLLI